MREEKTKDPHVHEHAYDARRARTLSKALEDPRDSSRSRAQTDALARSDHAKPSGPSKALQHSTAACSGALARSLTRYRARNRRVRAARVLGHRARPAETLSLDRPRDAKALSAVPRCPRSTPPSSPTRPPSPTGPLPHLPPPLPPRLPGRPACRARFGPPLGRARDHLRSSPSPALRRHLVLHHLVRLLRAPRTRRLAYPLRSSPDVRSDSSEGTKRVASRAIQAPTGSVHKIALPLPYSRAFPRGARSAAVSRAPYVPLSLRGSGHPTPSPRPGGLPRPCMHPPPPPPSRAPLPPTVRENEATGSEPDGAPPQIQTDQSRFSIATRLLDARTKRKQSDALLDACHPPPPCRWSF